MSRFCFRFLRRSALVVLGIAILSPLSALAASVNGTTVPPALRLIDLKNNDWTLASGKVMVNGRAAGFPIASSLLLYYNNAVYVKNNLNAWYAWTGSSWTLSKDPRVAVSAAVNGQCGASSGQSLASAPTSLCTAGTASGTSGSGPWSWSCSGSNGGTTASCSASLHMTAVNGACGASNGQSLTSAPASLCSTGAASGASGSGPWSWSCTGSNGGTTAHCSASLHVTAINGACGASSGQSLSSAPTSLCTTGTASAIGGSGPWSWSCAGSGGGNAASCSASLAAVNGVCGASNGQSLSTAPTSLCTTGTASAIAGSGPWSWSCAGSNSGATASCSATMASSQLFYGVNLSGAEWGSNVPGRYGYDYNYPTSSELDYYQSKGQNLIRVPFLWERMQTALNAPLDAAQVGYLAAVLTAADARGMHVIVDLHDYGRYNGNIIGSAAVPVTAFANFWSKLAAQLQGHTSLLGFDLMNEPHDMGSATIWPQAAQAAVNAIRTVDTTHYIMVEGDGWASAASWQSTNGSLDINDPSNLIVYEAHEYFDGNNSGTYSQTYDAQGAYPTIGVDRLAPFAAWISQHGYRGYIGEYGVPSNDARWLAVLSNFLEAAQHDNLWGTYWAGGPWWNWCNYALAVEQCNGQDAPQTAVLQQYPGH